MITNIKTHLFKSLLIGFFALAPIASHAQSTYELQVGSLYGADHDTLPTQFLSGSGPLDSVLYGRDFFIICLQEDLLPIEAYTEFLQVHDSPTILTAGVWGAMGSERFVMTDAARNMYYQNLSEIISDTSGAGTGLAYQFAVWYITTAFENSIWSGTLDSNVIDEIIIFGDAKFSRSTEEKLKIHEYLYTALLETPGEIYFMQSLDNPDYQPFAIVVIPEPSTVALGAAGLLGMMVISRRRRKS